MAMKSRVHELKCWKTYFEAVRNNEKRFEVRRDDRGFQRGDKLRLREWDNTAFVPHYTGNEECRRIKYVLTGGQFGIEPGYVVLGF